MRTERAAKRERTVVRSMTRVEGDDWTSISAICSCGRNLKIGILKVDDEFYTDYV